MNSLSSGHVTVAACENVDRRIQQSQRMLVRMEAYKRGLLQQMNVTIRFKSYLTTGAILFC